MNKVNVECLSLITIIVKYCSGWETVIRKFVSLGYQLLNFTLWIVFNFCPGFTSNITWSINVNPFSVICIIYITVNDLCNLVIFYIYNRNIFTWIFFRSYQITWFTFFWMISFNSWNFTIYCLCRIIWISWKYRLICA